MIKNRDLYFVAYLVQLGFPIEGCSKEGRNTMFHVGVTDTEIADAKAKWMTGEKNVNARAYSDTLRHLKAMIHEQ